MATDFCVVDESRRPLVTVHLTRAAADVADIDDFGDRMAELLAAARATSSRIRMLLIVDGVVQSSFAHQIRATGVIARLREDARACMDAIALVASNSLARGIVECVLFLQPLQSRHAIFDNSADALAWLQADQDTIESV